MFRQILKGLYCKIEVILLSTQLICYEFLKVTVCKEFQYLSVDPSLRITVGFTQVTH